MAIIIYLAFMMKTNNTFLHNFMDMNTSFMAKVYENFKFVLQEQAFVISVKFMSR